MNQTSDSNLFILRAIDFAARKHREQRRKDEESSPYINHPISVALSLAEIGVVTVGGGRAAVGVRHCYLDNLRDVNSQDFLLSCDEGAALSVSST